MRKVKLQAAATAFWIVTTLGASISWAQDAGSPLPSSSSSSYGIPTIYVPPTPSGEKSPGAAISPMKKGQTAPFTGVLFSPIAVANVMAIYVSMPQEIQIETKKATDTANAICEKRVADNKATADYNATVAADQLKAAQVNNERLRKATDDLTAKESAQWSTYTWTGLGAAGGIGLTLGIMYLYSRTTK